MAYLEINGITKSYDGVNILNNINLHVDKGSFVSLLGQSGCGKTTLLRIIAGLEQADSGTIVLNGKNITNLPAQTRNIGIVFQNYALFPHLNVFENIAYGLKIKKITGLPLKNMVNNVLEKVSLLSKANQRISSLSGGEQQRVALARAIVTEPHIILLDEPLSNLDHSLRIQARNELKRLQNEIGITSIYVTHDQTEALSLSDTIAVMSGASIVQIGSPAEVYHAPHNSFIANFVGHYNVFNNPEISKMFNYPIPANSLLAILPEHLKMHKSIRPTNIIVRDILFTGVLTEYILSINQQIFKSLVLAGCAVNFIKGEHISLSALNTNIKIINL